MLSYHLCCSFFFLLIPPQPISTLFPYTTLFRSEILHRCFIRALVTAKKADQNVGGDRHRLESDIQRHQIHGSGHKQDRKSTRLNSSHITISYAVFCLKKKKKQ